MIPDEEKTKTNFEQLKADALGFAEDMQNVETEEEMAKFMSWSWFSYLKMTESKCELCTCKEKGKDVCRKCFADWLKEEADPYMG